MNAVDAGRVREARERLRKAAEIETRHDHAVRVVALNPPDPSSPTLRPHSGLAILAGLSETARSAIADTVDGLVLGAVVLALSGEVEIDDSRLTFPLDDDSFARLRRPASDAAPDASVPLVASTEATALATLVETLESSVSLTSAELRGATALAQELRSGHIVPPEELRLDENERQELIEALDAITDLEPDVDLVLEIEALLADAGTVDPEVYDRAVAQYEAAVEQLQPTDSVDLRSGLEAALDAARLERSRNEAEQREVEEGLVSALDRLGLVVPVENALFTANRILAEVEELRSIRRRLTTKLERAGAPTDGDGDEVEVDARELEAIDARRTQLQRRLRSQQRLLAATRDQLSAATNDAESRSRTAGTTTIPLGSTGRPFPVYVEDPLAGVPIRLGATVLSVLLRLSATTQVLCAADEQDLDAWCDSVGGRAGRSIASGWFAGEE